MNHLRFLTSSPDKIDDSAISPSTDPSHSPQATPLAMRLENRMYLFWLKLTAVVNCVKGVRKGLLKDRAKVTLTTLTCLTVFMSLMMTTELARHSFQEQD